MQAGYGAAPSAGASGLGSQADVGPNGPSGAWQGAHHTSLWHIASHEGGGAHVALLLSAARTLPPEA